MPTSALPPNLDEDVFADLPQARGGSRESGFSSALADYVLLAACRSSEQARETKSDDDKPCGAFSKFLLQHLRKATPVTTYTEIMRSVVADLRDSGQHPLCEGEYKDRPLFKGLAVRQDAKLFSITTQSGIHTVNAGSVHGITPNSRFSIRELNPNSGVYKEVGVLEAREVSVGSSVLKTIEGAAEFSVSQDCRAAVQTWGSSSDILSVYFDGVSEPTAHHARGYRVASSESGSNLVVQQHASRISFTRGPPISNYIIEPLSPSFRFSPLTLGRALDMMGDFHYHLVRSNTSGGIALKGMVSLGIHQLENGTVGENLIEGDSAEVTASMEYGITIVNKSNYDLYPYLFFFDPTDYSIQVRSARAIIYTF